MKAVRGLLLVAGVVVLLQLFVVRPYHVTSESMAPTLLRGDVILVWKPGEVEAGDVVVFRPERKRVPYVKRVEAVGPAEVALDGKVWEVPEGRAFVLGDNRGDSLDSRHERRMGGAGLVPLGNVEGHAVRVLLSLDDDFSIIRPWTWYRLRHDRWLKDIM